LRHGWHVAVGYLIGFAVMIALVGWHPEPLRKADVPAPTTPASAATG
jgi:biotin transporter BioY